MSGIDGMQPNKDVTVDQLDYTYIGNCSSEKELAKILRVLRSGKEGFYPDLIEFCEKKLQSLNPEHRALRKQQPIKTKWDLERNDYDALTNEMDNWSEEMSRADQETSEKKIFGSNVGKGQVNGIGDHDNLPPVRGSHVIKGNQKKSLEDKTKTSNPDRIKSYDYKAWDKFDVDKECEKVDHNESKQTTGPKPVNIPRDVQTAGLTEEEKEMKAVREKEKGNEAFKSGDFEEALSYYCRSIKLLPIPASYNNRALVFLRLERWKDAVADCNKVLSFEGENGNLKAKLRRATAYKSLGEYDAAMSDLFFVIDKEPNNARAKSILEEVKKMKFKAEEEEKSRNTASSSNPPRKQGRKMVITEVDEDSSDENEAPLKSGDVTAPSQSSKVQESDVRPENSSNEPILETASSSFKTTSVTEPSKVIEKPDTNEIPSKPVNSVCDPIFPEKTADLKSKAGEFFKAGQYEVACEHYTKAIDSLSNHLKGKNVNRGHEMAAALLHNNRAACWLKQGNDRACITDCSEVLRIKVWDAKAFMRRATAYENLEKYAPAWADYQSAHSMDLTNIFAQNGANRVSSHLREVHGSKWREKVPKVERYPHHNSALIKQSTSTPAEKVQKNVETAEQVVTQKSPDETSTMQQPQTQSDDKEKKIDSVDTKPNQPEANPSQESKKKRSKNKKRGKSKVKTPPNAEDQNKDNAEIESKKMKIREDLYQKLKLEGNENVKKGNYQAAIDCYTRCLTLCPKETASYTNRALCFLKLKKHISAIQDCTEAIKLDPINVKAYYRRAQARKEEGYFQDAERDIKKLLDIDPGNTAAKKELDVLKKLRTEKSTSRASTVPSATNKKSETATQPIRKKQMVIEEVDSSSSSDEAEFILPVDESVRTSKKENKVIGSKIVVLDDSAEQAEDNTSDTPEQPQSATSSSMQEHTPESSAPSDATVDDVTPKRQEDVDVMSKAEKSATSSVAGEKPLTPYEFGNLWSSISNKGNMREYRALLNRVSPKELPSLLSNKIDDIIICAVAKIAAESITTNGDYQYAYDMMNCLTKAQRFSMAAMFLSDADKKCLQITFDGLSQHVGTTFTKDDITALRKAYCM